MSLLIVCLLIVGVVFMIQLFKYLKKKLQPVKERIRVCAVKFEEHLDEVNCTFSVKDRDKTKQEISERVDLIIKKPADGSSKEFCETSRIIAEFLAYNLYIGLKHPEHGQIIDEIVTSVRSMAEASNTP